MTNVARTPPPTTNASSNHAQDPSRSCVCFEYSKQTPLLLSPPPLDAASLSSSSSSSHSPEPDDPPLLPQPDEVLNVLPLPRQSLPAHAMPSLMSPHASPHLTSHSPLLVCVPFHPIPIPTPLSYSLLSPSFSPTLTLSPPIPHTHSWQRSSDFRAVLRLSASARETLCCRR